MAGQAGKANKAKQHSDEALHADRGALGSSPSHTHTHTHTHKKKHNTHTHSHTQTITEEL